MKRGAITVAFLLLLASSCLTPLRASDILYDSIINVNGSITEGSFSIAGMNSSGFNTATGEGTLIFTFSPGAVGSYFFDIWLDNDLSAPNFNEYGAVNGTVVPGQSWEIGDPTPYYNSGLPPGGLGPGIDPADDTALNTLNSTNGLPGNTDNFLGNCVGATCNGDASMAMGFTFTLTGSQQEVITLNLSETAPNSGFFLQQIHPVDGCDQNGMNCANPTQLNLYFSGSAVTEPIGPQTPEPGTWLLVSSAVVGLLLWRARKYRLAPFALRRWTGRLWVVLPLLLLPSLAHSQAITVLTVPWDPAAGTPAPHATYNLCSDGSIPNYTLVPPTCNSPATLVESTIVLGATAILPSTTDSYTGVWDFGDGSPNVTVPVSNGSLNNYNLGTTHQYPATAPAGTTWNAVLTVTDTTTNVQGNATYSVIQEGDTTHGGLPGRLSSEVNVAIDAGLWFAHLNMWRSTTTVSGNTVNWGGWDDDGEPCINGNICGPYGGLDANFVQAFEVNGHLANGPASDPYTDDVSRGLARMFAFLIPYSPTVDGTKMVTYNPAILVDRCSDGSVPNFSNNPPTCTSPATLIQYNPSATSCLNPPCTEVFDHNNNGQILYPGNDSGQPGYEVGMYADALVASGNPNGIASYGATASGSLPGVYGQTYLNIVTDLMDGIEYCQYYADPYDGTVQSGYDAGGGWQYYCAATSSPNYDDNSVSQWNAIGLIAGFRGAGFNVPIPAITQDTNQVWVTYSQDVNANEPCLLEGNSSWNCTGIANNNSVVGAFGYGGYYAYGFEPWGAFAVTPSGMVQMAMDGIGRTAAGNPDQRWNLAESFYHDNFCYNFNTPSQQNVYMDPLYYTYGMFSFSKSMLLHDPGFNLSPIQFLEDQPAGTNPIDWYGAISPAHGGTDACDGFAQTLLGRQASDGHWGYPNYFDQNTSQSLFETAWALIILKGTVFTACIQNVSGKGKPKTPESPATVTLTWSHQSGANGYKILRSTSANGTYTAVGTTTSTVFVDKTAGLQNDHTYYYYVQPLSAGTEICQSNQAVVTIPKYHP
ncbi:MAG: hypothetical protein ACLP59_18815 [Bryobacteraceae bacterium]